MDKKVSFLICGVQKAGTTALYTYLKLHPKICMETQKEVHFFDNETFFPKNQSIIPFITLNSSQIRHTPY